MQMVLAISTVSTSGFIKQRIMAGFPGIEHVIWQNLVLASRRTEDGQRLCASSGRRGRYQDAE
jgi:hypothetical protein